MAKLVWAGMWSDNTSTTASPDLIRGPLALAVQLIGCE
jgi:hypothetical protein